MSAVLNPGSDLPVSRPGGAAEPRRAPLVLLVEDDDSSRSAVCELLRDAGFRVRSAPDGEAAVEMAAALHPDAVVTDLAMPRLNGLELANALRGGPGTSGIPVVAMTASWLGECSERLAEAGFAGALRKPCSGPQIVAELRRVLASSGA